MRTVNSKLMLLIVAVCLVAAACGSEEPAETAATQAPSQTTAPAEAAAPETTQATESTEPETMEEPADTAEQPAETTQVAAPDRVEEVVLATIDTEFDLTALDWNYGYPGLEFVALQYDTLAFVDEQGNVIPWLATSWELNDDASEWTFTLRDDVRWHDGESFTAKDVAFTVDYHNQVVRKSIGYSAAREFEAEVVDDHTVIVRAPTPEPDMALKLKKLFILPQHLWEGVGAGLEIDEAEEVYRAFDDHTGTGPFKFVSFDGATYVFEANDDYFHGPPTVQRLVIPIISNVTAMFSAMQSGEIHASANAVPPESVALLESDPNIALATGTLFSNNNLLINNSKEPWSNPVVRNAIANAIDIDEIIDFVALGAATPGSAGMLHPDTPLGIAGLTPEYDPAAAAAALDGLGYLDTDGDGIRELTDGTPMSYELSAWSEEPQMVRIAELIAEYLGEIGIEVIPRPTETNTALTLYWPAFNRATGGPGPYDIAISGWSPAAQEVPAKALDEFFHSHPERGRLNLEWYTNPEMDAMLDQLAASTDEAERNELMREIQMLAFADMPRVTIWYPNASFAYRPEVYDGWRSIPGLGIINKLSFLQSY